MEKNYIKIEFPTKKRWLKNWWQKNINIFLYAIENDEIQKAIKEYRSYSLTNETAKNKEDLKRVLKRVFLKDVERHIDLTKLKFGNGIAVREGDDYSIICKNGGTETKWKLSNPFEIFDGDIILKPQTKLRLIEMLSDPANNGWIFEQRYSIHEQTFSHPPTHNVIDTLHNLGFLRSLEMHILSHYNLDYFVFWPMFFYYALTDDVDFVINNVIFLNYPIKLFLVDEEDSQILKLRLYGDCNFEEIYGFIKSNKKKFNRLNKLMGNSSISSRDISDYYIYKTKKEFGKNDINVIGELSRKNVFKLNKNKSKRINPEKSYSDYLKTATIQDRGYQMNNESTRKAFKKEINRVRTVSSQVKKEIHSFNNYKKYQNYEEIKKIVDDINNYTL